jgi:hypothetical protein
MSAAACPLSLHEGDLTMATNNIEKALTVFRGIASRDPDLTTKYMNPGSTNSTTRTRRMELKD